MVKSFLRGIALFLFLTLFLGPAFSAGNNEATLDTEILNKLEKILTHQAQILQMLSEMKEEIQVVKIRMSLKSHIQYNP